MGPPLPQFTAGLNLVRDWGSCLGNPSMPTIVLVTYLSQVALTIVLGVVLLHFYRQYRHDYLLQWCRSWWALAVYLGFGVLAFSISSQYAPLHPFRFLPMATALMAGYMSAGWLLFGTDQLATGSVPSPMRRRFTLATRAGSGLLSGLLFTWDPAANFERFFVRIGLRSFVVGIAFLVAAWQVWRSRQVGPGAGRLGRGLVGASFGLYGLELLVYAGIGVEQLATHQGVSWVTYLGFIDFVLQTGMGLGMVIWLLEEERSKLVRASGQIEHLAYHDILTGLPNRLLFLDRLEVALAHARRTGGPVAVYFLDLDRFKIINDSLGHSTGDELLQLTAERLQRITRAGDTVARLGGDEFILLVRDIARTEALKLGRKLLEIIREPFALSAQELHVRTSIGVCLFPEDGVDAEALLKNADTAMYRAKETGRDTCCVYEAAMNERALERLALENDFRKAITNRELEAFYQPISHLATGRVVRAEALLRWRHPTRGLLLPGDFLSLAEVLGLTDAMDFHTLLTACRQAKAWRGSLAPELKVAVNVSAPAVSPARFRLPRRSGVGNHRVARGRPGARNPRDRRDAGRGRDAAGVAGAAPTRRRHRDRRFRHRPLVTQLSAPLPDPDVETGSIVRARSAGGQERRSDRPIGDHAGAQHARGSRGGGRRNGPAAGAAAGPGLRLRARISVRPRRAPDGPGARVRHDADRRLTFRRRAQRPLQLGRETDPDLHGELIMAAVTLQPQHPAVHIPHQIAAVDVGAESALDPLRHAAVGTGRGNAGEQRTDAEVHSAPLGVQARLIAGREQNRRRLAPAAATRVAQRRVVDLQAEHPALVGIAPEPHAGERIGRA